MNDYRAKTAEQDALEDTLNELLELVNREVEVFQELLSTLTGQYSSVLKEDAEAVADMTSKVRELVERSKILEHDRLQRTSAISSQLGEERGDLTLSELIPLVEDKYASALKELRGLLLLLARRIKDTNLRNKKLLNRSLRMVNRKLKLLSGASGCSSLYNQKGAEASTPRAFFNVRS